VITGYLLAGSIIGPGGLNFISEMVQVCYVFDLKRFKSFVHSQYL
jgi:Kef-type K+ transport system membrane component KefB